MKDHTVITALITGPLGGGAVALGAWLRGHRKDTADAELTFSETWKAIVAELRGDIADLRGRVATLEDDLAAEKKHAKDLEIKVERYRDIIRSLLRHTLKLRDALAEAHAEIPPTPPDIEDALTGIDLP